jgi:hypothetical protein
MVWIHEDKRIRSDCHRFIIGYVKSKKCHILLDRHYGQTYRFYEPTWAAVTNAKWKAECIKTEKPNRIMQAATPEGIIL